MVPPACRCVLYIFNILRNSSDVPQISVSVRIPEITATPFIPVLASFETFERLIPPIATTGIATLLHIFFNISKDIITASFWYCCQIPPRFQDNRLPVPWQLSPAPPSLQLRLLFYFSRESVLPLQFPYQTVRGGLRPHRFQAPALHYR